MRAERDAQEAYEIDRARVRGREEEKEKRKRKIEREVEEGDTGRERRERSAHRVRRTERKDTPGACAATPPRVREKDRRGWLDARERERDRESERIREG